MTLSYSSCTRAKRTFKVRHGLSILGIALIFLLGTVNPARGTSEADFSSQESSTTITTPMMWKTQRVNPQRMFLEVGDHSLGMDSTGKEHITFGGDHLYYSVYDGTNWAGETVDAADNVGQFASLFIDPNDHPHISYYDAYNGSLKYARNLGGGWEIYFIDKWWWGLEGFTEQGLQPSDLVPLDGYASPRSWQSVPSDSDGYVNLEVDAEVSSDTEGVGLYSSIALDANGNPYISYYDAVNGDLKCARLILGIWKIDTVDSIGVTGMYTSIAVDDSNPVKIYISYYDYTNGDLRYAVWNGSKWSKITADATGNVGQYTSIALDSTNKARISYYDVTNKDLKYAYWDGSTFTPSKVDGTSIDVGMYTSIALFNHKQPHISYYDTTHGKLRYAAFSGSTWSIDTLSTDEMSGRYSSIVLDPNNNWYPSVSYYAAVSGYLKMVKKTGVTTWQHSVIDQAHDQGAFASMDLDSLQNPHVAFMDDTVDVLNYAYWDGSAWHVEVVDDDEPVGLYCSLILDASNAPHISYWDPAGRLRYATKTGGTWQIEYADPATGVGKYTSIGLDLAGLPYISYYDSGNKDLRLTHKLASGSWDVLVVDDFNDVGKYSSLAIDSAGLPHISYYNETSGKLKYAYFEAGDWIIQVIGQIGDVGLFTSLALDGFGNPHIAYFREDNDRLMYANHNGSSWLMQEIDASGSRSDFNISVAVDSSNNPFISYVYATNLKVAHWTGSEWHWQTIDYVGDVGRFSSIKILNTGYPVVAYYDASNGDLKYATSQFAYQVFLPYLGR